MNFVRIGDRYLNLDQVTHVEELGMVGITIHFHDRFSLDLKGDEANDVLIHLGTIAIDVTGFYAKELGEQEREEMADAIYDQRQEGH